MMDSLAENAVAPPATAAARLSAAASAGLFRPLRSFVLGGLIQVPLHMAMVAVVLVATYSLITRALPADSILGTAGTWSVRFLAIGVGLASGALIGAARVAHRVTDQLEAAVTNGIRRMNATEGERIIPALPLTEVRQQYEAILDKLVDGLFERIRVPGVVRRLTRRGLRQAPVEEFLSHCESQEYSQIGFVEVRNWAVVTGIPFALAPIRAKIRTIRLAGLIIALVFVLAGILLGFLVGGAPVPS